MDDPKKDIKVSVRMESELYDKIVELAKEKRHKPSTQIREIIIDYFEIIDRIIK